MKSLPKSSLATNVSSSSVGFPCIRSSAGSSTGSWAGSFLFCGWIVVSLSSVLGIAPLAAQVDTFEARSDIVEIQVPVNVTRGRGEPVRGLSIEDFEILDDGRPQTINSLRVVDLETMSPNDTKVMDLDYDVPGVARRHVLFLFDLSFSNPMALSRAREAAQEFALDGLHPSDLAAVAVHTVEAGTQLLLTFTPDRVQLARAINTMGNPRLLRLAVRDPLRFLIDSPDSASMLASRDVGGVGSEIRSMENSVQGYLQIIGNQMAKMERSYAAGNVAQWSKTMGEMADGLGAIEGRKQIVWFSEGFDGRLLFGRQPDPEDIEYQRDRRNVEDGLYFLVDTDTQYGNTQLQNQLVQMLNRFRDANCVIHAVDISGLRAENAETRRIRRVGSDALFYIANETGGRLYEDATDFGDELGKVLETTTVTYVLTFNPTEQKGAGEAHRLKVSVEGHGRVQVSHRTSYVEPRPYGELPQIERNLLAADLIATATRQNDLDIEVLAAPFRANDTQSYIPVIIEIGGASLLVDHSENSLPVELYAYATDETGQMKDFFTQLVSLDLEGRSEVFSATGLKYYGHLMLDPGRYLLRVLVRNGLSGRTGVQALELKVPQSADREPVLLPPFFLEEPGSWFLVREQEDGGSTTSTTIYPFTVNGEPYVPAAAPQVSQSKDSQLCLVGYNLSEGDLEVDATVRSSDGSPVAGGRLVFTERTVTGINGLDKLMMTFRPEGLDVGRYTLEVAVSNAVNQNRSLSSIPMTVLE